MFLSSLFGFSKLDVFVGLVVTAVAAFYNGQVFASILCGLIGGTFFSWAREYFSWQRICNTFSALWERIDDFLWGWKRKDKTLSLAMPKVTPYGQPSSPTPQKGPNTPPPERVEASFDTRQQVTGSRRKSGRKRYNPFSSHHKK